MKKVITILLAVIMVLSIAGVLVACNLETVPYKVIFLTNGGKFANGDSAKSVELNKNGTITMPDDPTKENFNFAGWFLDNETFKQTFTKDTLNYMALNKDTNVYAKWEAKDKEYDVVFDLGEAFENNDDAPDTQKVIAGGLVEEPEDEPECDGWEFLGWFLVDEDEKLADDAWDFEKDKLAIDDLVEDKLVLCAKWKAIVVKVTFDANTGKFDETGNPTTKVIETTVKKDNKVVAPTAEDVVLANKVLIGWTTEANKNKADKLIDFEDEKFTADTKLFACWADAVTVTFNLNGATGTAPTAQTIAKGTKATKPTDPTHDGYTFKGWFTKNGTSDDWGTEWVFTTATVSTNTTLYAKWEIKKYTVTFDGNDGKWDSDETQTVQTDVLAGYKVTAPATNPTREGYTFKGWTSTKDDAETLIVFTSKEFKANTEVYALWEAEATEPDTYTVTFDGNGGKFAEDKTTYVLEDVEDGDKISAPTGDKLPTYAGHTLEGWYTKDGTGTGDDVWGVKWNFDEGVVEDDLILYAKWTADAPVTWTVTFDKNTTDEVTNLPTVQTINSGGNATEPATNPTRAGYTFKGWYTDVACTEANKWVFATEPVTADIKLYAKWEINTYTVTLNANGGKFDGDNATKVLTDVAHGSKITVPTDDVPVLANHAIAGWFTKDGTGTGEDLWGTEWVFGTEGTTITKDITLYAKWTEHKKVTIDFDGGSITGSGETSKVIYASVDGTFDVTSLINETALTPPDGKEFEKWVIVRDAGEGGNIEATDFEDLKGKITALLDGDGTLTENLKIEVVWKDVTSGGAK